MASTDGFILHIDTSTEICSVALSRHFIHVDSCIDDSDERRHAQLLPLMIDDLLKKCNLGLSQISAVAYSQGPGSYTGLRVGLSSAKAICMAKEIPLIAVLTLQALAYSADKVVEYDFIIPMIDAGRNEVYHAVFDNQRKLISSPAPLLLEQSSIDAYQINGKRVLLVGDGSVKAKSIIKASESVEFGSEKMLAQYMIVPASHKFLSSEFENLAYSVPFYLKYPTYKKQIIKI